jgi:23S rRNA pseudouridine955/2504/2580 synthase
MRVGMMRPRSHPMKEAHDVNDASRPASQALVPDEGGRHAQSRSVGPEEADIRLDRWFKRHFPDLAHSTLQKLLRSGQVRVDGKRAEAGTRLMAGQAMRIPPLLASGELDRPPASSPPEAARQQAMRLDDAAIKTLQAMVIYKDEEILVLNKPPGLAVQGGTGQARHLDGMLDFLRFEAQDRPRLVHRLDKDTSGCLLLGRSAAAAARLAEHFRSRRARKIYWAVTVGVPSPWQGRIDLPLAKEMAAGGERMMVDAQAGQWAQTYYAVLERAHDRAAFVALWPKTGRTHQLRVHMHAIGAPVLGDGKYAGQGAFLEGTDLPRQLHLHARRLILPHPVRAKGLLDVTAPLPEHMRQAWDYFGFSAHRKDDPFAGLDDGESA